MAVSEIIQSVHVNMSRTLTLGEKPNQLPAVFVALPSLRWDLAQSARWAIFYTGARYDEESQGISNHAETKTKNSSANAEG